MWVVIPYVAIQMTTFDVAQRKFRAWASDGKTKIPNHPAISASDISTPSRLFFPPQLRPVPNFLSSVAKSVFLFSPCVQGT